jgi:hypothetical protein
MTAALISACNSALARIAKGSITSLDEGSIESEYCTIFAPEILNEMADWCAWPEMIARTALAEVANDRPAEWKHAYAKPADFAKPIAIRQVEEPLLIAPIYSPPFTLPLQDRMRVGYTIEGGKVYTNVERATLVYVKSQLLASDLSPSMRLAFVEELAARLAVPVAKLSANAIRRLEEKAMMAKAEAIADAENSNERMMPAFKSEGEWAREGFIE